MTVLTDPRRIELWRELMEDISAAQEGTNSLPKADLRAAVNAADNWVNANSAAYNTALPLPARTTLTASQKARLLLAVIRYRYVDGS